MAKNLYKFQCFINNTYNTQTFEKGKTFTQVELLPMDYPNQKTNKIDKGIDRLGLNWITYKCNDPKLFWQEPQQ